MDTQSKNIIKRFLVPAVFANLAVWVGLFQFQPDFLMHINFYDVGQGDAVFIQTHLGNQILIDGGPSDTVLQYLGEDMPFFDRTIELVILTHAHADHVAGLVDVLKRYRVQKVILPKVNYSSGPYSAFLDLVKDKKIETVYAHAGQRVYLDEATVFDIYYPNKVLGSVADLESQQLNDTSIFGKLSFGQVKVLFTGDAGTDVERMVLPQFDLNVDLLKVGHHGSRYSTSQELLAEATPDYAVISVGQNNYGHPTEETLENLKSAQAVIYRTDQDKTVQFVSDGTNLYRQ